MIADANSRDEIAVLIHETFTRLSTPGSDLGELFTHLDMTIAGSRLGEFHQGQGAIQGLAKSATSWGFTWTCEEATVWREGDVAWTQILVSIEQPAREKHETVRYRITGVFAKEKDGWQWRHWGGSQPREAEVH